jgi:hypothetical protein
MAENELNEVIGDVPAIPADEPTVDEPADGAPAVETDVTPDPTSLEADITALQARRDKAQKEAGYWQRKELESRRAAMQPAPAMAETPAPATAAEPNQDDFDDYNDYVGAVADHRVKVARQEWERESADKTTQENNNKRQADLQTKLESGYAKYDDFAEVAFDHTAIHITPMIVDILADCDNPADVAYHLAKNRVEGVSISRMTPTQAARAVAKIDLSYADGRPPPPKKTTNAPPPINPVGASNTVDGKDPDKMTQAEFNAHRVKQGAKPF